jgi:hypothetical protein
MFLGGNSQEQQNGAILPIAHLGLQADGSKGPDQFLELGNGSRLVYKRLVVYV